MERKPFHKALVEVIFAAGTWPYLVSVRNLVGKAIIPSGHREIIAALESRKEPGDASLNELVEQAIKEVQAQEQEAQQIAAEKADKVADKQRIEALETLARRAFSQSLPDGLKGHAASEAGRKIIEFNGCVAHIARGESKKDFEEAFAKAEDLLNI